MDEPVHHPQVVENFVTQIRTRDFQRLTKVITVYLLQFSCGQKSSFDIRDDFGEPFIATQQIIDERCQARREVQRSDISQYVRFIEGFGDNARNSWLSATGNVGILHDFGVLE